MFIHPLVRSLFSRFENLNLVMLREDLRRGLAARGDWLSSGTLCPLAHGLAGGEVVRQLRCVSQAVNLEAACHMAAQHLGSPAADVYRFVNLWDESERFGADWLLGQLEALWEERLEDAVFMQELLVNGALESHETTGDARSTPKRPQPSAGYILV